MQIGVLGTGTVGRTLARALAAAGHEVTIGSRSPNEPDLRTWADKSGVGTADLTGAVAGADLVMNALPGLVSFDVVSGLADSLAGVTLVDVSNPLDFSEGFPPSVRQEGGRSLGEQLQSALPQTRVVKALNTVNNGVMVQPSLVPGEHVLFICGDDDSAKAEVHSILEQFGWRRGQLIDLGDITAARATENYLQLWVRLMGTLGSPTFNVAVLRGQADG